MELEWDEAKRQEALATRGIDFADVAYIDPASLRTWQDLRHDYGEVRSYPTAIWKTGSIPFAGPDANVVSASFP